MGVSSPLIVYHSNIEHPTSGFWPSINLYKIVFSLSNWLTYINSLLKGEDLRCSGDQLGESGGGQQLRVRRVLPVQQHLTFVQAGNKTYCYETIMFGQVTHTIDAEAKRVRSFVLRHSHSVTLTSVVL